jgi:pantothenate kinase
VAEVAIQAIVDLLPAPLPASRRFVIAIAGPPASGKSTLAAELCAALASTAGVLALDAFHYDNQLLEERGDLAHKGAPHTFDVDGYANALSRLRSEPSTAIAIPEFDRDLELTRNAVRIVSPEQSIVITEGNYLLLDEEPWRALVPLFDLTVWLDVSLATIEQRIIHRWTGQGLEAAQTAHRLADNDLPNAQLVLANSCAADMSITFPGG